MRIYVVCRPHGAEITFIEPDSLSYQYHGFLIAHGGIGDRHGKQSRKILRLMGDGVKAAEKGVSAKFIAPPLDLTVPIPFEENIATGMPIQQMNVYLSRFV